MAYIKLAWERWHPAGDFVRPPAGQSPEKPAGKTLALAASFTLHASLMMESRL